VIWTDKEMKCEEHFTLTLGFPALYSALANRICVIATRKAAKRSPSIIYHGGLSIICYGTEIF